MDRNTIKIPEGFELEIRGQSMTLPEGFELEVQTPITEPMFLENPEDVALKAKRNLDTAMQNDVPLDLVESGLWDVMINMTADPVDISRNVLLPRLQRGETVGETVQKAVKTLTQNPVSRLMYKGLGILGWPFQRIENLIAGPLAPVMKEDARRASLMVQYIMDKANGLEPSEEAKEAIELQNFNQYIRGHAAPTYQAGLEAAKAIIPAVKALNPWSKVPQKDLKTFVDVYRGYWQGWMNDEPPPEWIAQPVGIATSFVVTPYLVGKVFQLAGKLGKATPVYKAIQEYRIPEYQKAKQLTRLETGAKIYDASELGKTISQKDLTEVTKQLSAKLGKPINESAVQQRLVQIIKGGITEQPVLAAKANPIIDEFRKTAEIAREYGLLSDYTYTTRLTKAQVAGIRNKIDKTEQTLTRLQKEVPYQEQLLTKISGLHPDIEKQKRLTEKFIGVAVKAEQRGKKLSEVADEFIDAAIEVTTGSPLSQKITTLLDFAPGDKRLTGLGNRILSLEKMERVARNKEANQILTIAAKINPKVSKYVEQTISDVLKVAEQIEDTKVIGQMPLFRYAAGMKYTFPGKAEKIKELEETIATNLDRLYTNEIYGGTEYFPRLYLTKEAEQAAKRFPFWSSHRIRAAWAKARGKISPEARKQMGEIHTEYPVVKRLIQEGIDIELAKHYRQIAQTPGWTSSIEAAGFKMLPEDKAYGELAGKFVKSVICNDLKDMHYVRGNFLTAFDTAIGSWKAAVTVWSPSLHFRNMWSNSILLDLSGVDHAQQAKLLVQAAKEITNNTDDYQQALRYLSRGTFSQAELLDDLLAGTKVAKGTGIQKSINFVAATSKKMSSVPSDIYGKEEFLAKFVKYLSERNKGKDVISAVQEANKWLFDYGDLSSFEKNWARRIMPFYTFPRKALPRVMEAMAERPHTIAKYAMFHWGMEKYSLHQLQLTEADYAQIKNIMPDYMKNGSYMLMPYRDNNGDLRFFDLTYILPWGTISDFQQRGVWNVIASNPLYQLIGDIQRNKDSFTGKKIWEDTDTESEKHAKQVLHFWQSAAPFPPWFPGGIYYDKIYEAVTGKPSKKWDILLEKQPSLPETLLHTFGGIRLAPLDVEKQTMFYWQDKQQKFIELEKKISDAFIQQSAGNISQKQLEDQWQQYIQQMVDLISDPEEEQVNPVRGKMIPEEK